MGEGNRYDDNEKQKSQYSPKRNNEEKALEEGLLLVVSKWTEGSCFGVGEAHR